MTTITIFEPSIASIKDTMALRSPLPLSFSAGCNCPCFFSIENRHYNPSFLWPAKTPPLLGSTSPLKVKTLPQPWLTNYLQVDHMRSRQRRRVPEVQAAMAITSASVSEDTESSDIEDINGVFGDSSAEVAGVTDASELNIIFEKSESESADSDTSDCVFEDTKSLNNKDINLGFEDPVPGGGTQTMRRIVITCRRERRWSR
jgi:hypothetical protein